MRILRRIVLVALGISGAPSAHGAAARVRVQDSGELLRQASAAFKQKQWALSQKLAIEFLETAPSASKLPAQMLLAESYFRQGKWPEALSALERVQKEAGQNPFVGWSARLRAAETLIRMGQGDKARELLREVKQSSPFGLLVSEALLDQGYLLLIEGREGDAEQIFQELLQTYPQYRSDPRLGKALGYLLLKTGSLPQANEFLNKTVGHADWGDPRHLFLEAMAYMALGNTQEATRYFRLVYKYSEEEDWRAEALYQIGEGFLRRNMLSLASQSFEEILSRYPTSAARRKTIHRLAIIALMQGKPQAASALAEKILAMGPQQGGEQDLLNAQANYILGEAAIARHDFQSAKVFFQKAVGAPALAMEAWLKLIWLNLRTGDYNHAIAMATDFLNTFPWGEHAGWDLLLRGLAYQKGGSPDKAAADYTRFLDMNPSHPLQEKATYLLASSYLQSKRWPELVSHASVAYQKLPPRPTQWQAGILLSIAEGYYALERYAEALNVYRELVRRFPPSQFSPHTYQGLALCAARLNKYDGAFAAQEKALALSQTYKNREIVRYGLLTLGDMLFNKRRYKSALAYYDAFIRHFAEDALLPEALYRSASALNRLRKPKAAIARWRWIVQQYPTSSYAAQALLDMGRYYFKAGLYREAEETFSRLVKMEPQAAESKDALLLSAQALFNQGLYQEAIARYEQFKQKYPDDEQAEEVKKLLETSLYQLALDKSQPQVFLSKYPDSAMAEDLFWDLGLKYWKQKDYGKALENFQQLALHFPSQDKTKRAMYLMADIYFRQGNFKEAAAAYQGYIESNANEPKLVQRAFFRQAVSQFQQDLPEEAAQTFAKFIQEYPKSTLAKDAYYNLILAHIRAKRPSEALEACRDYLKHYPNDPDRSATYLQMGNAFKALGQVSQAAAYYRKVPKKSPLAIEAYYNLGQLYQEQEDYGKARAAYALLVPLRPRGHELRISGIAVLAEIYERMGNKNRSLELYKEVIRFSKNPEWTQAAREKIAGLRKEPKGGTAP